MTVERIKSNPYFFAAIFITVANVALIWAFRFLPLYDYPIWLYEVRIMRALSNPLFRDTYEIISGPVPNLGFVGPIWLLSFLMPLEVAGKVFLTVCVIGLPWSFWYAARKLATNPNTPIAFAAFPFAFSIYFFGGHAFLLGLIVLLLMIGSYFPKLERLSAGDWFFLSLLFLLSYFIHALSFVLAIITFGGAVVTALRSKLYALMISFIPSLVCLIWYLASNNSASAIEPKWSLWGLAQNVFKPLFLFIKSYGIPNPLPLTLMNVLWSGLIVFFILQLFVKAKRNQRVEKRFIVPVVLAGPLVLALPELFLGVVQPGSRFGLPLLFFILLMFCRVDISERWKTTFLSVALLANTYNAFHFRRVDEQMEALYLDIKTHASLVGSFMCVRLDWPPERKAWDVAAASIDPMFGAVYYAALENGGLGQIFGASVLRVKQSAAYLSDRVSSSTPEEQAERMVSSIMKHPWGTYVLVGRESSWRHIEEVLIDYGFVYGVRRELWCIRSQPL